MKPTRDDKLDCLIRLALSDGISKDDVDEFDALDVSEVNFSKRYYRWRKKIVRREKCMPMLVRCKRIMPKVAMILLTIMSVGFIAIMSISALRDAVWETLVEWYEDYFTIRFEPTDAGTLSDETTSETDSESQDGTTTDNVENTPTITPPSKIEEVRKPTYLPDGVEEEIVLQNKTGVFIEYYKEDVLLYTFKQSLLYDRNIYIDNESVTITNIDIDGNPATVIQYDEKREISVIWNDGEYIYNLKSEVYSMDDLLTIANSIN